MSSKISIKHNRKGWRDIFTSPEMGNLTDQVGQRIANDAGDNFFYQRAVWARDDAVGKVVSKNKKGDIEEATEKVLTKAVHK